MASPTHFVDEIFGLPDAPPLLISSSRGNGSRVPASLTIQDCNPCVWQANCQQGQAGTRLFELGHLDCWETHKLTIPTRRISGEWLWTWQAGDKRNGYGQENWGPIRGKRRVSGLPELSLFVRPNDHRPLPVNMVPHVFRQVGGSRRTRYVLLEAQALPLIYLNFPAIKPPETAHRHHPQHDSERRKTQ